MSNNIFLLCSLLSKYDEVLKIKDLTSSFLNFKYSWIIFPGNPPPLHIDSTQSGLISILL